MLFPVLQGQAYPHAVGKVVCVGRNYAAHARELNNPVPATPILFIKPADSVVSVSPQVSIPTDCGSVHHELEIAVLIGQRLVNATDDQVRAALIGVGLGLDLTLRDVQDTLKQQGHPWERAKAFDGACPLTDFIAVDTSFDWSNLTLVLIRNGERQQMGSSADMLFPIISLIAHMSTCFTLNPGDVVLTGTPAGVGPLSVGDQLQLQLQGHLDIHTQVCASHSASV